MENILEFDNKILILINGSFTPFWDFIMYWASNIPIWIPLYIAIATAFFFSKAYGEKSLVKKRYSDLKPGWVGTIALLSIITCFGLCDQISVFIKEVTYRVRPGYNPELEGIIRLIDGKGHNLYSFVSSHATSTFGLATLSSLILRRKYYSIFMICWAAVISFSRIYLAHHYPLDVVGGIILGISLGLIVYTVYRFALNKLRSYITPA